jgi:Peptidase_C39 like family
MSTSRGSDEFAGNANLAAAHLSVLTAVGALPSLAGGRTRIAARPTPVYDVNGELLFWRARIDGTTDAFVDVAAHPALGGPLVSVSQGVAWTPEEFVEQARRSLPKRLAAGVDSRFVAYSFPKVAVQFLRDDTEVALVELFSWTRVPEQRQRERDEPPGNFERWSYLDELPARKRRANERRHTERVEGLSDVARRLDVRDRRMSPIDEAILIEWFGISTDTRELHYSGRASDHATCYELRGQETNVWCVVASVQMVLDFYRYNYDQTRVASQLALGTKSNPIGLPYSRDGDTATALDVLSDHSLTASMNSTPTFAQYRSEILANRPLVSFIPGHSRSVGGYTRTRSTVFPSLNFNGLCVFDPWPPNAGVITRWENFDTQTYRRTFTAHVTLA